MPEITSKYPIVGQVSIELCLKLPATQLKKSRSHRSASDFICSDDFKPNDVENNEMWD